MIQDLFTPIPHDIHDLRLSALANSTQYDYELQDLVGLSGDPYANRRMLAARLAEEDFDNFYRGTEQALSMGLSSEAAADITNSYIPRPVSEGTALEQYVADEYKNQALQEDETTYNNSMNPDNDIEDQIELDAMRKSTAKWREYWHNQAYGSFWQGVATVADEMLTAIPTLGTEYATIRETYEALKDYVPLKEDPYEYSNWEKLSKDFTDYRKKIAESGPEALEAFDNDLKEHIEKRGTLNDVKQRISDLYAGDVGIYDTLGGIALAAAGSPTIASALKAAGNRLGLGKAARVMAESGDVSEIVPSVLKESKDLNYFNDKAIREFVEDTDKAIVKADVMKEVPNTPGARKEVEDFVENSYKANDAASDVLDVVNIDDDKMTVVFGSGINKDKSVPSGTAERIAKKLNLENYKVLKADGTAGSYIVTDVFPTEEFGQKAFGRMFYGSTNMPEWFHKELLYATRKGSVAEKRLYDTYGKNFISLNKYDKNDLDYAYYLGQKGNNNRGVWTDVDKLVADGKISQKAANAYKSLKAVSDLDYNVADVAIWKKLGRYGYVNDTFGDIVKPIKTGIVNTKNFSHMRIKYGDEMLTSVTHSAKQIQDILNKTGNILVEVSPVSVRGKALNYTHKIIKNSELTNKLKRGILPYRAGGRRRYEYGTNFLKIGQTMMQGNERVNAFSRTIAALPVSKEKEAYQLAKELNIALEMAEDLKNGADTATVAAKLNRTNFEKLNISELDDLRVLSDNLDVTQRVQVLKEGEQMVYNNGLRTLFEEPLDYDSTFAEMSTVRGNYYSKRGKILTDLFENEARLVDVSDIFDQTIKRISQNAYLSDLYENMGNIFKDNYIDFIDTRFISNPRTLSGEDLLRYGKFKELGKVPATQRQALREAIGLQRMYKRLSNTPTEADKVISRYMNNLAGTFAKTGKLDDRTLRTIAKTDPMSFGRALLFQTTMGMFNLKQLWTQAMGALTMTVAHPILFTRAILGAPIMTAAYLAKDTPVAKQMFKAAGRLIGISEDMAEGFIKYMDEFGTTMGTYRSPAVEHIRTNKILSTVGKTMRWPVEYGTNYANIVNDLAAYIEGWEKAVKTGTKLDIKKILSRADDFAMNQTRATQSAFQAGQILPTRTIAQFTSWPARVMESVMNRRLTPWERTAIMLGQIGMWGVAGTAFTDKSHQLNVNRWLSENLQFLPEGLQDMFISGVITSWSRDLGWNIEEGIGGAGIPSAIVTAYNALDDMVTKGELPDTFEITLPGAWQWPARLGGTARLLYQVPMVALDMMGFKIGEGSDYDILHDMATYKYEPAGPKNIARMLLALSTGNIYNTQGRVVAQNVTDLQALGQLGGFGMLETDLSQELYTIYADKEKAVKEVIDTEIKPILSKLNFSNSDEVNEKYTAQLHNKIDSLYQQMYNVYGVDGVRSFRSALGSALRSMMTPQPDYNEKSLARTSDANKEFIARQYLKYRSRQ